MKIADLLHRKVEFFRAHIEPGILTMPKNALHHTDKDIETMEITEVGIYVKIRQNSQIKPGHLGQEFLVPFSNCQTVRILPANHAETKPEVKNPSHGPDKQHQTHGLPKAQ